MTLRSSLVALGMICTMPGAPFAQAETPSTPSRYDKDRALCLSGKSNQDRATCLKEAGAVRDAARQGPLSNGDSARHRVNALERCKALKGDDARDCVTRVNGGGTVSGSVESGGVYRESVTTRAEPASSPASQASAAQ